MKRLRNITLEISAKALVGGAASGRAEPPSKGPRSVTAACSAARTMFRQWRALADRADQVSVLLWTADGSELLDWSGDFSDTFEWACWCGCANHLPQPKNPTPRQRRNTHFFPAKMFAEADCAPKPYSWLRDAVAAIRAAAREELGREIRVGTTFDNGPEFAISDFKFRRHREVMLGNTLYPGSFLVCSAALHADARRYAAFPDGIPEGLSVGAFLGAQYREFARDFGIDYIWLSNGMGFGQETWGITGALFDKKAFHPERIPEASEAMRGFWRDFFVACPDAVVETRGSNFSAGLEMATDAAPLGELYAKGNIEPPVNSPWAALNFNTGLELAAWMSHVAELPKGRGFPFRFYPHDPWFLNSPWLDRYARQPWDIYAPLSISRVNADGSVQTPDSVAFLSVDDTLGHMPEQVPREVVPHILDAIDTAPDRPAPFVWVYPFEDYCATLHPDSRALPRVFNEDFFLGEALQGGLPLNTVISTANWRALACCRTLAVGGAAPAPEGQQADNSKAAVFVLPVSALLSAENLAALDAWEARGARFLVYGSLAGAPQALLDRLGLALAEPLDGEFEVCCVPGPSCPAFFDTVASGALSPRIRVTPAFDGGGLCEVPAPHPDSPAPYPDSPAPYPDSQAPCPDSRAPCPDSRAPCPDSRAPSRVSAPSCVSAISPSGARRVLAARRGAFAFVRAVTPCDAIDLSRHHFDYAPPTQVYPVERLMRAALAAVSGWSFAADLPTPDTLPPRTNLSRHDAAFLFHVFAPDTTASLRVRAPYGAPLVTERETSLADGAALWRPDKSWRVECRLFVEGQTSGIVSVKTSIAAYPGFAGHLQVKGLENAILRFFPPTAHCAPALQGAGSVELVRSNWNALAEPEAPQWEDTPDGPCAVWRDVSGPVYIAW